MDFFSWTEQWLRDFLIERYSEFFMHIFICGTVFFAFVYFMFFKKNNGGKRKKRFLCLRSFPLYLVGIYCVTHIVCGSVMLFEGTKGIDSPIYFIAFMVTLAFVCSLVGLIVALFLKLFLKLFSKKN